VQGKNFISLADWLTQNPGPYWVQVMAARADGNTDETCGVFVCEAERVDADPDLVVFQGDHGMAVFVTKALTLGIEPEPGKWVGRYANLTVPVPGYTPEAGVVVMRKECVADE